MNWSKVVRVLSETFITTTAFMTVGGLVSVTFFDSSGPILWFSIPAFCISFLTWLIVPYPKVNNIHDHFEAMFGVPADVMNINLVEVEQADAAVEAEAEAEADYGEEYEEDYDEDYDEEDYDWDEN